MILTYDDVLKFSMILSSIGKNTRSIEYLDFIHFITVNKLKLKDIINTLNTVISSRKIDTKYLEYSRRHSEILIKYASKDANGNPIYLDDHHYVYTKENIVMMQQEIDKLKVEFNAVIKANDKRIVEIQHYLLQTVDVDILPVNRSVIPDGVLDVNMYEFLVEHNLINN